MNKNHDSTTTTIHTRNPVALQNIEIIKEFFSLYLKDKARFYTLWVDDIPSVLTPFVSDDVAVCKIGVHSGWDAVKAFWDPIFDEMTGSFEWTIDDFIVGEDPNTIVTKAQSAIDVQTGDTWGNKHLRYNGRYVQIFRFRDGKVESFEEYYDTALLNAQYS
ncbi:ketosteroid isomerase-like protein [Spongiibacter sp. IMCC21906]|uniref:nuclear transport factor 2 family protein n=1 Tax=Spongiibacter sp. IMCC21906 TaxID=1620392 RepID=UPI00062DFCC1|nr:nuclear transport factor 2 family protein [Spongiibacter sp. IMCC21906]AKH70335.1 ketosteroid isomerase-like protein [Spongiibacter sp. IMCC21906]